MKKYIKRKDKIGIIAEIKKASPSAGTINEHADVAALSIEYMQSGASALSVLTDNKFFNGTHKDLSLARKFNYCPILRKDFIIDEYQILESKSMGADCILLIASCLSSTKCNELAKFAKGLGLEVLLEVHKLDEIKEYVNEHIDIIGVNNRKLDDFTIDIENSIMLAEHLPSHLVKISESGIRSAEQIKKLQSHGYDGFLIGSYFMQNQDPASVCKKLISQYQSL